MICDENEENNLSQQIVEGGVKSRKISIFKEFLRHDKNIICLPRQFINSTGKALNLLDFSYYIVIFTNDLPKLI